MASEHAEYDGGLSRFHLDAQGPLLHGLPGESGAHPPAAAAAEEESEEDFVPEEVLAILGGGSGPPAAGPEVSQPGLTLPVGSTSGSMFFSGTYEPMDTRDYFGSDGDMGYQSGFHSGQHFLNQKVPVPPQFLEPAASGMDPCNIPTAPNNALSRRMSNLNTQESGFATAIPPQMGFYNEMRSIKNEFDDAGSGGPVSNQSPFPIASSTSSSVLLSNSNASAIRTIRGGASSEDKEALRKKRLEIRKQKKSEREKMRRVQENEYFERLADLCGLDPEKRDKKSILTAVIEAIKDEESASTTSSSKSL